MSEPHWRSSGMRDLDPAAMRRFRSVERCFLDITAARGYEEIRTPTIEPLHLYTGSGALSPELLDRVYSFLDWDGWSGERVVLRADATVPVARWVASQAPEAARLSYVQPVYRFQPGDADRELWQLGVELFGPEAAEGDSELLTMALELLAALGIGDCRVDLGHAGLWRAVLEAAGLEPGGQVAAYDRILSGDATLVEELARVRGEGAAALRLLAEVDGDSLGYVANLTAAVHPFVPEASGPLADLRAAAAALERAGARYRIGRPAVGSLEYYSGLTFHLRSGEADCISGGRYDGLTGPGGRKRPAGLGFCRFAPHPSRPGGPRGAA